MAETVHQDQDVPITITLVFDSRTDLPTVAEVAEALEHAAGRAHRQATNLPLRGEFRPPSHDPNTRRYAHHAMAGTFAEAARALRGQAGAS